MILLGVACPLIQRGAGIHPPLDAINEVLRSCVGALPGDVLILLVFTFDSRG